MNKKILVIILFFIPFFLFANNPPISGSGWYWNSGRVYLNGRWFFSVSESFCEQDGYALVGGRRIHYWLYDTITYHNGNAENIYNLYIPNWVEKMGYVIDFDNIRVYYPNLDLASSVRLLMQQRGVDVSVALITDSNPHYVVINEYFPSRGTYKTTIYHLYK